MPRPLRQCPGGYCYHVLNRGNGREAVFLKAYDYKAIVELIAPACDRIPMRILSYCIMPNHFHFVLWPQDDDSVSPWMQWFTTSHVRRYHQHYRSCGHVWQGRFKCFPIESGEYLLRAMRYTERNPLKANLVTRAEEWEWSSLPLWSREDRPEYLVEGPIRRPLDWMEMVNTPLTDAEYDALHDCGNRGKPFGSVRWQTRVARTMGLSSSLRPLGRPKKKRGQATLC